MSKEVFRGKRVILGFDETNNGFDFFHTNPNYHPCQIITGYAIEDLGRANYGSARGESKRNCGFFKKRKFIPQTLMYEIVQKAKYYVLRNPDFLYTTISKEAKKSRPIHMLKGDAIAALTIEFLKRYELDSRQIRIIFDKSDGDSNTPSERIQAVAEMWLERAGLTAPIPIEFKRKGDSKVIAIRKADIIGYYLAALYLLSSVKRWPFRYRKVSFSRLEESLVSFSGLDYEEFSEIY